MITDHKEILNFKEVAELLGISKSLLYKLTSSRKIPCLKPTNGKLFFKKDQVLDWLQSPKRNNAESFDGNVLKETGDGK